MKTPIQEFIEYMDLIAVPKELDKDIQSALTQFHTHLMFKINDLLKKEKELIIRLVNESYSQGAINMFNTFEMTSEEISKELDLLPKISRGEVYYNEKFNNETK